MSTNEGLTHEKSALFTEIVGASLRMTRREHLFSWLQSSFQYLFPHEVMFCGINTPEHEDVYFEYFGSIHYDANYLRTITSSPAGMVWRAMNLWQEVQRPVLLASDLLPGDYGSYTVPCAFADTNLAESGLHNLAAHGVMGQNGNILTFFCLSCVPQPLGKSHAQLLELLIPYLHSALIRVAGHSTGIEFGQITGREREVLQWLKSGKTNWEIAQILGISPNTVKNHVQNILRKLNVQNRSHAAAKASSAWLVKK